MAIFHEGLPPEPYLNAAGYATGTFKLDDLPSLYPLHTYTVQAYDMRRGTPARREINHIITAASAEHAIHIVAKRRHFQFTRRDQNNPDPARRDNAHYQVDPSFGYRGFQATRLA